MDASKIYNYICKFIGQQIERINRLKEDKRKELRGYSDAKIKWLYKNRNELGDMLKALVDEEISRRGMH